MHVLIDDDISSAVNTISLAADSSSPTSTSSEAVEVQTITIVKFLSPPPPTQTVTITQILSPSTSSFTLLNLQLSTDQPSSPSRIASFTGSILSSVSLAPTPSSKNSLVSSASSIVSAPPTRSNSHKNSSNGNGNSRSNVVAGLIAAIILTTLFLGGLIVLIARRRRNWRIEMEERNAGPKAVFIPDVEALKIRPPGDKLIPYDIAPTSPARTNFATAPSESNMRVTSPTTNTRSPTSTLFSFVRSASRHGGPSFARRKEKQ